MLPDMKLPETALYSGEVCVLYLRKQQQRWQTLYSVILIFNRTINPKMDQEGNNFEKKNLSHQIC